MTLYEKIVKSGKVVGPSMILQWATDARDELKRPAKNREILQAMANEIWKATGEANKGVGVRVENDMAYVSAALFTEVLQDLDGAATHPGEWALENYRFEALKIGLAHMFAYASRMQTHPFPAFRHYYTATSLECREGMTRDFVNKHVSGTDDAKSGRNVARVRVDPSKSNVESFGKIKTSRSGGLSKDAVSAFAAEIRDRRDEFLKVHQGLSRGYAGAAALTYQRMPGAHAVFDHLTFETAEKYEMFEFRDAKLASKEPLFIKFSLSSNAEGDAFAVHHLAGAKETRGSVHGGAERVANLLGDYGDQATTVKKLLV